MDEMYLPTGVEFKEPSRYKGNEAHSILKLWRSRQENGEVVFKFEKFVGPDKEPEEPEYDTGIFEGLKRAGKVTPHVSRGPVGEGSEEEEDEDDNDNDTRCRRYRAAASSSSEEEEEIEEVDSLKTREGEKEGINADGEVGEGTEHWGGNRPRPQRRVISPTEDDPPTQEITNRTTGTRKRLTTRRVLSSEEDNDADRKSVV